MESRDGPIVLKTFFSKVVGRISSGLEEIFIVHTRSAKSCKETGEKLSIIDCCLGGSGREEEEGVILALALATLFTKYIKKLL